MSRSAEERARGRWPGWVGVRVLLVAPLLLLLGGCSIQKLAVDKLGEALAGGVSVYASDDDPELVRDALPFALKTIESLLVQSPENLDLLLAASSGFTQYSYAFVDTDAFLSDDPERARELEERAVRLYLRARDYGLRGLELEDPGIGDRLRREPAVAAQELGADQIDLMYWTAAAWGSAISLALDRPDLVADLEVVRALLGRALELEPEHGNGALHEAFISIEALPRMMGGSAERARHHFQRAVELSQGRSASPFVSLAGSVAVAEQDLEGFRELLDRALAVDPDGATELRLANRIAQKKAAVLRSRAEELFLDYSPEIP